MANRCNPENNNKQTRCCKSGRCRYNDQYSKKWVDETSLYGIYHIFKGKSKIRRIIWALILVGLTAGCLIAQFAFVYFKKMKLYFIVCKQTYTT